METFLVDGIHAQLVDRRARLAAAIGQAADAAPLVNLLQQVDSALERMQQGVYGLCDECHDPVEQDRLLADPLLCLCLDHLNAMQKEALQQDLELASRIQAGLLPKREFRSGTWEAQYHYEPAGVVSGDFCELLHGDERRGPLFFCIGDVSGKGVAASLLMAHLHAIFRSLAALNLPLAQLVDRANRIFCESTAPSSFATLVCGRASEGGQVELCNAGHCPPLVFPPNGVTRVEATGLPLGLFASSRYAVRQLHLTADQGIFLYTDGLTEARNQQDEEYGTERLSRLLESKRLLPSRELVQACRQDLAGFQGGAPRVDDLTLMVVRQGSLATGRRFYY